MNNKIGVLIDYTPQTDLLQKFQDAQAMGIESCHLCMWNTSMFLDDKYATAIKDAMAQTGFTVTALWAGWSGPCEWNFTGGPATIGLVPAAYRFVRYQELITASDFAEKIGVDHIITHAGFIPENPDHPDFNGLVCTLRNLCNYMKAKGQSFLFETGQETPVTLLRTIQAIGTGNVGINFDTANLIVYGKANSLDALETVGPYVMELHIKDGLYPVDGMELGVETPAGQGKANFPAIIKKLKELGYQGSLTIEREISGEAQRRDIAMARELLLGWMAEA